MQDVDYLGGTVGCSRRRCETLACRVEIPAADVRRSAAFYEKVFGWEIRGRGTGRPTFAWPDTGVTGAWTTAGQVDPEGGVLFDVRVDDLDGTLARVWTHGGEIVETPHLNADAGQWIATFRDPAGNVIGLYQEGIGRDY